MTLSNMRLNNKVGTSNCRVESRTDLSTAVRRDDCWAPEEPGVHPLSPHCRNHPGLRGVSHQLRLRCWDREGIYMRFMIGPTILIANTEVESNEIYTWWFSSGGVYNPLSDIYYGRTDSQNNIFYSLCTGILIKLEVDVGRIKSPHWQDRSVGWHS